MSSSSIHLLLLQLLPPSCRPPPVAALLHRPFRPPLPPLLVVSPSLSHPFLLVSLSLSPTPSLTAPFPSPYPPFSMPLPCHHSFSPFHSLSAEPLLLPLSFYVLRHAYNIITTGLIEFIEKSETERESTKLLQDWGQTYCLSCQRSVVLTTLQQ
ncbi:uncharacterized protein LOC129310513 [Prosopis cineraria]|uniref:uncharacterized protein LOC129310513 n=1 Tax=Prosopis cineraria TaxID=364024 RepID=UPI00240F5928|nr:uncharacterized protein LOC129310513 [Prosopis cineraria]